MAEYGRRLHAQGLISGSDGNISARLPNGRLLVTPSGVPKAELAPRDMVIVDLDGRPYGRGRPSSELRMHLEVYRRRERVTSAIHAHPPWVIAASIQPGLRFDFAPESIVALAGVYLAEYARPGTLAVARSIAPGLASNACFVLSRHGSLTVGDSLDQAFRRLENLEHNAKIAVIALSAGGLTPLPEDEVGHLKARGYAAAAGQPPGPPARGQSRVRISDEEELVPGPARSLPG